MRIVKTDTSLPSTEGDEPRLLKILALYRVEQITVYVQIMLNYKKVALLHEQLKHLLQIHGVQNFLSKNLVLRYFSWRE